VKGLWFGYYKGFFKSKKHLKEKCLNLADMEDEVFEIMYFIGYGQFFPDMLEMIGAAQNLYEDNSVYCEFTQPFIIVEEKCNSNPDACALTTLFTNA
jgi:hypothetical protein